MCLASYKIVDTELPTQLQRKNAMYVSGKQENFNISNIL